MPVAPVESAACGSGWRLPQYDFSVVDESPLTWATVRDTAPRADAARLRLRLALGPSLPRHREVRRERPARGGVRADRHAGRARPRGRRTSGSARSCSARRCARRRCSPRRSPRSTASPAAGSTSGSAPAGTSPSTRRSAWTSRRRASASPASREAVDILTAMLGEDGGPVRLRRAVPPHRRRAEPPDRGAAPAPAGVRRRQGRPAAPADRRAGRRLEHLLGVDARGVRGPARGAARAACDRVGRDPATVWCSLGLYALCGEDEADLERRFERLRDQHARRACSTG